MNPENDVDDPHADVEPPASAVIPPPSAPDAVPVASSPTVVDVGVGEATKPANPFDGFFAKNT